MSREPEQPSESLRPNSQNYRDDTAYLMSRAKNAARLNEAIEQLQAPEKRARQAAIARRKKLMSRLEIFRGRLPADYKFNRDEANER